MIAPIYIGLMSGTSFDAIDAVAVRFEGEQPRLLAGYSKAWSPADKQLIMPLFQPSNNEIAKLAVAERRVADFSVEVVQQLLEKTNLSPSDIVAIGSHGQTVRHYPDKAYTLQIGDPNRIAEGIGITTVADFRRRDMAAGGQGAPLVPAFHQAVFSHAVTHRVVLNIGGMSNISILPATDTKLPIAGFDTGPGNVLMDGWMMQHWQQPFDTDGKKALAGTVNDRLLNQLMSHPFFSLTPPKSTGRELFNAAWFDQQLQQFKDDSLSNEDVMATLAAFTAKVSCKAIAQYAPFTQELYVCGGGANNLAIMQQLQAMLPNTRVQRTSALGIDGGWVEAMAFAWLAKQTLNHLPGNSASVTGAKGPRILGGVYVA